MPYRLFFLTLIPLFSVFFTQAQSLSGKDDVIIITTDLGNITLLLYDHTPKHKKNFIKLVNDGFYDGTTFHRIIDQFMIQGGDPNSKDSIFGNEGSGGPGYTIPPEFSSQLKHVRGALAAARLGDNVNPEKVSSGSQFYIVQNPSGTPHLDNAYTVFGQTVNGFEVVDQIARQSKNYSDRPLKDIKVIIKTVRMRKKKIIKKYHCIDFYKK